MTKNGLAPDEAASDERPLKRQRLTPPSTANTINTTTTPSSANIANGEAKMENDNKMEGVVNQMVAVNTNDLEREREVGIVHYVNLEQKGFSGVLKQRYTDFLVNEIALDGTVLHLRNDRSPNWAAEAAKANDGATTTENEEDNAEKKVEKAEPKVKPEQESEAIQLSTTEVKAADDVVEPTKVDAVETQPSTDIKTNDTTQPEITAEAMADTPIDFTINPTDEAALVKYFGDAFKDEILQFHQKVLAKPWAKHNTFGSILSPPFTNRVVRGQMHGDMRRIFQSRLETLTVDENIKVSAMPKGNNSWHGREGIVVEEKAGNSRGQRVNQSKGKLGWQDLGGEYLHFNLFKENKDTMEVMSYLAKLLKIKPRDFSYAGTKDRRAVTVQRVSIYRQHSKDLARYNNQLRQARIGDFKYEKHPLKLGDLNGNLFTIALRDCHFEGEYGLDQEAKVQLANEVLSKAVEQFETHGFLNYFGLQRFGTFGIGTHDVGKLILNDDFEGAVKSILTFNHDLLVNDPASQDRVGRDDIARARAINLFETTNHSRQALEELPRKFSAEGVIIRHLGNKNSRTDFFGALRMIPRNLKTMYVHAYQSLVWNTVGSERWSRYGTKVVEGDLVMIAAGEAKAAEAKDEVDQNGEVVIHPAAHDAAIHLDDMFERARALTAEEAESGKYSIFDVVLPTPGFDVEYPSNAIGDFYKEFMGSERGGGLDPANMRRKDKDFSLSGNYRKLMSQAKNLSYEVKWYHSDTEQLAETDLDIVDKNRPKPKENDQFQQRNGQDDWNQRENNNSRGAFGGRGRGNRGGRGQNTRGGRGRFNNDYNGSTRAYRDIRLDDPEEAWKLLAQTPVDEAKKAADETKIAEDEAKAQAQAASLNAWSALPAKLMAEQEAAIEAAQIRRETEPAIDSSSIVQPDIVETFIQTGVDDQGRRSVVSKTTTIVGVDGETREVAKTDVKANGASKPVAPEAFVEDTVMTEEKPDTQASEPAVEELAKVEDKIPTAPPSPISSSSHGGGAHLEPKLAVIVKFALGSSQYATMALRELLKAGGVQTYKPDFSSGR